MAVFFLLYFMKKAAKYLLSIILLQSRNSTVEMLKLNYKNYTVRFILLPARRDV